MIDALFHGYLAAFALVLGAPLGCAVLLMMFHLTGGRWGRAIRPFIEGGASAVWAGAALFLPLLAGLGVLYPWTDAAFMASEEALRHKAGYLNIPFFVARAVVILGLWAVGGLLLVRRSRGEQRGGDRPGALAAGGLLIYALTLTIAALDWFGSLQPSWYSTVWAVYVGIGHILTGLALAVLLRLRADAALDEPTLRDLGNLLLAFVVLHAYLAYSQLFITWVGDKPHEIEWYLPRWSGVWAWFGVLGLVLHFALPFALLLFRGVKHRPKVLARVAALILVGRALDAAWIVLPASSVSPWLLMALAAAAMALTGAALWWLVGRASRRAVA